MADLHAPNLELAARGTVVVRLMQAHDFGSGFAKALLDTTRDCVLKPTVDDSIVEAIERTPTCGAMLDALDALADGIASAVADQSIIECDCGRIAEAHVAFDVADREVHVCDRCLAENHDAEGYLLVDVTPPTTKEA